MISIPSLMALGEGLAEGLEDTLDRDDRVDLQEAAEDDHIEHLDHILLSRLVHCVDAIDVDILAGGRSIDAVAVVDEASAGLHLALELVERGLVKHYHGVVRTEDRG